MPVNGIEGNRDFTLWKLSFIGLLPVDKMTCKMSRGSKNKNKKEV